MCAGGKDLSDGICLTLLAQLKSGARFSRRVEAHRHDAVLAESFAAEFFRDELTAVRPPYSHRFLWEDSASATG
jgi:hypothetical protein